MAKSRSFSIFLLKSGWLPDTALKDDHELTLAANPIGLPPESQIFIFDAGAKPPWWREYFGIQEEILQELKGAVLFVKADDRYFALSFGFAAHNLNDFSYEHDFGLRVTLNSLDPQSLKSTDTLEPGVSRRRRTQVPRTGDLTFLDFDNDAEIMRSMTGNVREEYKKIFKHATGSSSLKVSLRIESNEIPEICVKLFELYKSNDYETHFPNIQKIIPVKDPEKLNILNNALVGAFRVKDESITLTIPDIIDYRDWTCCLFRGDGEISDICPEVDVMHFYQFYEKTRNLGNINLDTFKSYQVSITNSDGFAPRAFSIYRSVVFDLVENDASNSLYHFSEGAWYKVDQDYITELKYYLDERYEELDLSPYNHDNQKDGKRTYSEENYNLAVPGIKDDHLCLDQTSIAPSGQKQIEACDIYAVKDKGNLTTSIALLYNVKISVASSQLSHLFNQGVNAVELVKRNAQSQEKLKKLVLERCTDNIPDQMAAPIDKFRFKIVFAIITRKTPDKKSDNLPLFSKISLRRVFERLQLMSMEASFGFVEDKSRAKENFGSWFDVNVEIYVDLKGNRSVRVVDDSVFPKDTPVSNSKREMRESTPGKRFRIKVRETDGKLRTFHAWPYTEI